MKPPIISCPHCKGEGRLPLSDPMLECVTAIKQLGVGTLAAIHEIAPAGSDVTATYSRIKRLLRLGLVRRVGEDRPMRFSVSKPS